MAEPEFRLEDLADRQMVREAIVALCRRRAWRLLALHVRTTHVHGLVQAEGVPPNRVMGDWKANVSHALKSRWPDRQRFWTRGGDVRSVRSSVDEVLRYILDGQGEPMEIYVARPTHGK
jgi:REP element-mobilizing transposase RayT